MDLIEKLVEIGVLKKERALELVAEAKNLNKKIEEIILEKKLLSEEELFELKAKLLNLPLKKQIDKEIPLDILKIIPEETAKYYKIVPLSKEDKTLNIGMVYPEDLKAQEAINFLSRVQNFNFKIFLITPTLFKNILQLYRAPAKEVENVLEELETVLKSEKISLVSEEALKEEAPISKMVAVFLKYGIDGEASDIHIEPLKDKVRVRYRRMGVLYSSFFLPLKFLPAIVARVKILSNLRIDETRIPQDGRFSIKYEDRNIDFRVSTFPTSLGEKVAIRILDPKTGLKKFEELGLSGRSFEVLKRGIEKPYGMILATGPTGCGKTTTLYAILQILNKEGVNIVTLEDPVEYSIEGINQSQIRPEIGYTFAEGLRHVLRQDPDIILVGEIRDKETASLAVHAALTGHLVLSTLHTNDAFGVIPRLIDLGVQPFLISAALRIALSQRLVRKLCEKCKKKVRAKKEIKELISKELEGVEEIEEKLKEPLYIYEPQGCPECAKEGFSGRIGIFEVLEMTPEIESLILKEPSETKIREEAKKQKIITMRQDGFLKVLEGITTVEEVLRETS
jgi:type IV pilus assembly protein PilB